MCCPKSVCWLCLCCFVYFVNTAHAQRNRFTHDEAAMRALRYASWEAGTIFNTTASPYSSIDVRQTYMRAAQRLDGQASSDEAFSALGLVIPLLANDPHEWRLGKYFGLMAGIDVTPEIYWRVYEQGKTSSPWTWNDRAPLISLPIEFFVSKFLYAKINISLKEDHNTIDFLPAKKNWSNWPESMAYLDFNFPFEAWTAFDYGIFSASGGRNRLRWGPGRTGTLVLSDEPDFYDYVEASLTGDWLSYRVLWISLDASLRSAEEAAFNSPDFSSLKNYFLHRLDVIIVDRVGLGIVEGLLVGGIAPTLAMFNPLTMFHNLYSGDIPAYDGKPGNFKAAGSIFGVDLRANPWKYMELYASFAMNQFQTTFERSTYTASGIPNALAALCGIEAAYPLFGGWITGAFEYVYTNPWMYIRATRLNSFSWRRRLTSNIAGADQLSDAPLGYRYGPDAMVFYTSLGWDSPGWLGFCLSYEHIQKGQNTLFTPYEESHSAAALKTPSGIPKYTHTLSAEVSWTPLAGLTVYGAVAWIYTKNAEHIHGATASALDTKFGVMFQFPAVLQKYAW